MQVYLNSLINKSNFYTQKQGITKPIQSKVESLSNYSMTFMATPVLSKTISSQIAHEKSKLLKQINDILAQEVKLLTSEEKLKLVIKQASNILKSQKKKLKEIEFELDATINSPFLNPQQKNERVAQLRKKVF